MMKKIVAVMVFVGVLFVSCVAETVRIGGSDGAAVYSLPGGGSKIATVPSGSSWSGGKVNSKWYRIKGKGKYSGQSGYVSSELVEACESSVKKIVVPDNVNDLPTLPEFEQDENADVCEERIEASIPKKNDSFFHDVRFDSDCKTVTIGNGSGANLRSLKSGEVLTYIHAGKTAHYCGTCKNSKNGLYYIVTYGGTIGCVYHNYVL